jgi:hypothetical protein
MRFSDKEINETKGECFERLFKFVNKTIRRKKKTIS